jgi:hypothetical protein
MSTADDLFASMDTDENTELDTNPEDRTRHKDSYNGTPMRTQVQNSINDGSINPGAQPPVPVSQFGGNAKATSKQQSLVILEQEGVDSITLPTVSKDTVYKLLMDAKPELFNNKKGEKNREEKTRGTQSYTRHKKLDMVGKPVKPVANIKNKQNRPPAQDSPRRTINDTEGKGQGNIIAGAQKG